MHCLSRTVLEHSQIFSDSQIKLRFLNRFYTWYCLSFQWTYGTAVVHWVGLQTNLVQYKLSMTYSNKKARASRSRFVHEQIDFDIHVYPTTLGWISITVYCTLCYRNAIFRPYFKVLSYVATNYDFKFLSRPCEALLR